MLDPHGYRRAGTTFANVVERGDYDPSQHAGLSLGALDEILVLFGVDYYPQRFNRPLGGRPIDLWRNDPIVPDGLVPYPPSADDLRVLTRLRRQCDRATGR